MDGIAKQLEIECKACREVAKRYNHGQKRRNPTFVPH
jgi:hypothetical protein